VRGTRGCGYGQDCRGCVRVEYEGVSGELGLGIPSGLAGTGAFSPATAGGDGASGGGENNKLSVEAMRALVVELLCGVTGAGILKWLKLFNGTTHFFLASWIPQNSTIPRNF